MINWQKARNILCIRPDNLGDVLMTTPAIRALKDSRDDRRVTLLTSKAGGEIANFIPEVDDIMTIDLPWVKTNNTPTPSTVTEIVDEIKQRNFDAAVIFTNFSQNPLPTAMLAYLANIPLRLSYCRENPYDLLTDWVPDKEPFFKLIHGVKRQMNLVETIGAKTTDTALSLRRPGIVAEKLMDKLLEIGLDTQSPWIIMHVGASEEKRRYPGRLFARVAEKIIHELGFQILFTGTQSESHLVDSVRNQIPAETFSLTGDMSLEELIAAIDQATLLISNNTGPVHIAAALQTPVVVLYANTNSEHTPWNVLNRVLYFEVPENLQTKNQILQWSTNNLETSMPTPDDIIVATKDLLSESAQKQSSKGYVI